MSDQVNVGDYSLEISGDEVVVRDESGAIVETVELDDVDGELTLPDGQKVDLASILADAGVENFQTAAGPANDNLGSINGGPAAFTPFHGTVGRVRRVRFRGRAGWHLAELRRSGHRRQAQLRSGGSPGPGDLEQPRSVAHRRKPGRRLVRQGHHRQSGRLQVRGLRRPLRDRRRRPAAARRRQLRLRDRGGH